MKPAEKTEARRLRSAGMSMRDIAKHLDVSRGTVSLWVRDIPLTAEQIERLDARIRASRSRFSYLSRCGAANTNRVDAEKRHRLFKEAGYERAKADPEFRVIAALYWGEGQKSSRYFAMCNSDPGLLKVIFRWLVRNGFEDHIRFVVRYHPDNGLDESEIRDWWFDQLPLLREKHLGRFGQVLIHRASQRKKIGKLPYGTATLSVFRTELFFNVLGGIDFLRESGDW